MSFNQLLAIITAMSRILLLTLFCTSCTATSNLKSFEQEQQNFPVFFIGNGFSWDSMIFEDSIVYSRTFSDGGAILTDKYPIYSWIYHNDSTIHLRSLPRKSKRSQQLTDQTLVIDKSSELCQLLIPLDSLERFNKELREEFQQEIVNYRYNPPTQAQEVIDVDSVQYYPMLLNEDFSQYLRNFTTKFESIGIYNGKGF